MAFWKPAKQATVKAQRRREWDAERHACLDEVWARAGGRCEVCGMVVKRHDDPELRSEFEIGAVHEVKPRSLGGNPLDGRAESTRLLCVVCHQRAHGLKVAGRPA